MSIELTYTYRIGTDNMGDDLSAEEQEAVADEMYRVMGLLMTSEQTSRVNIVIVQSSIGCWMGGARPVDADKIEEIGEYAWEQALGCVG